MVLTKHSGGRDCLPTPIKWSLLGSRSSRPTTTSFPVHPSDPNGHTPLRQEETRRRPMPYCREQQTVPRIPISRCKPGLRGQSQPVNLTHWAKRGWYFEQREIKTTLKSLTESVLKTKKMTRMGFELGTPEYVDKDANHWAIWLYANFQSTSSIQTCSLNGFIFVEYEEGARGTNICNFNVDW